MLPAAAIPGAMRRVHLTRLAWIAALAAILAAVAQIPALAQSSAVDTATSRRLTDYLRKHRLPLVGAQITRDADGGSQVMLYGYVATSFGRTDAETKARKFLKQPGVSIVNRIKIRPEILHLKSRTSGVRGGEMAAPNDPAGDPALENDHGGAAP